MSEAKSSGVLMHPHPSLLRPVKNDLRSRDGAEYHAFFQGFVADVKERGIVQPVLAYQDGDRPRVIDGQTRLLAALIAGLESLPVLVLDQEPDEKDLALAGLQANAMRQDMTWMEYARAYKQLMDLNGWSQSQLADNLKVSTSKVSKILAIISRLPDDLQAMIGDRKDQLCISTAASLARLPTQEEMRQMAPKCLGLKRDAVEVLLSEHVEKKKTKGNTTLRLTHGGVTVTIKGNAVEALKAFLAKAGEAIKRLERDNLPPHFLSALM